MIKLPVLETTFATWSFIWRERTDLFYLAAPFVVAVSLVTAVLGWISSPSDFAEPPNTAAGLIVAFQLTFGIIVSTLFSVSWHRRYLVPDESITVKATLAWTQRHWRFLRAMIILMGIYLFLSLVLIVFGTLLLAPVIKAVNANEPAIQILGLILTVLVLLYFTARFCLLFPAAAVDQFLPLKECWQYTRGNGWRILMIYVLANIPLIVFAALVGQLLRIPNLEASITFLFISTLIQTVISYFGIAVGVSALSHIYKFLSNAPQPQPNLPV